jgi:hypothetical protein
MTTITTSTVNGAVVIIALEPNGVGGNSISIAVDYTPLYTRIANDLQQIRELAEGPGIHVIKPYAMLELISLYQSMIEQTSISTISPDYGNQAGAIQKYKDYVEKMTATLSNPWNLGTFDSPGDYPAAT